ncbi:universal stress protein [Neolewinella aurantiaca]|uniref:Universal stress protein n=1 Tax=Neolewinella aurantiaca TaxID=2602767 RepID=A0A5C7FPP1_9BACT|nr:universal stress protein [Neolewinella aurantiaca]TXF86705.1 universal stress protein [Neolewinella aurantiaca]
MIKKILVPVDFSAGSAAALHYAEAFAAFTMATEVKVIHVFTPQVATGDVLVVPPMGELMDQRDEAFEKFLASTPAPAGITRKSELLLGFAADKIVEHSKDFDIVVMGCTGDADLLEEVFGSIASEVSQKASCPVLLVPDRAKFKEYENILYASNSLSLSRKAVLKFRAFNDLFHARVHFVHINDEEGQHAGKRESLFAPLFNNPDPEFAFEIQEVTADSVQEGLVDYLQAKPIELAVMVTKQRGFWASLFHTSDTKQMILHPETPLLVLHLED